MIGQLLSEESSLRNLATQGVCSCCVVVKKFWIVKIGQVHYSVETACCVLEEVVCLETSKDGVACCIYLSVDSISCGKDVLFKLRFLR